MYKQTGASHWTRMISWLLKPRELEIGPYSLKGREIDSIFDFWLEAKRLGAHRVGGYI